MKNEQDIELGLCVMSALSKSLREYFFKNEDSSVAEVCIKII